MKTAIDETNRRRAKQAAYNDAHGIQPASIVKAVRDLTERLVNEPAGMVAESRADYKAGSGAGRSLPRRELERIIKELEKEMKQSAKDLEFERAAALRDQIFEMRAILAEDASIPPWKKARLLAGEVD